MIRMNKMLFITALLAFLLTETSCLADSKGNASSGGYIAYNDGIVKDNNTGLEWRVGPDKDTTWRKQRHGWKA